MATQIPFLFTPITKLTDDERISQLVPLGLFNAPGARGGAVGPASVKPARLGVPSLAESTVMPGAVYAFVRDGLPRLQLAAAQIKTITTGLVTWQDEQAESAPQKSAYWSAAWRTGLTGWTNDVAALVGAWVRAAGRAALQPEWRSCADISAMTEQDLWVWLPGWEEWRLLPWTNVSATREVLTSTAAGMKSGEEMLTASDSGDIHFQDTFGPCKDYPPDLFTKAADYRHLKDLQAVHVVDRTSVRHYPGPWGHYDKYPREYRLLPQVSVVFVRGPPVSIQAFYEWMRHVAEPIYPVLHDVEWMTGHVPTDYIHHNKLQSSRYIDQDARSCGHPSLLLSTWRHVAVALLFEADLDNLRKAVSLTLGITCTDGAPPDWVPEPGIRYPHVVSVAAGWALTDPRVGWRVCVSRGAARALRLGNLLTRQDEKKLWRDACQLYRRSDIDGMASCYATEYCTRSRLGRYSAGIRGDYHLFDRGWIESKLLQTPDLPQPPDAPFWWSIEPYSGGDWPRNRESAFPSSESAYAWRITLASSSTADTTRTEVILDACSRVYCPTTGEAAMRDGGREEDHWNNGEPSNHRTRYWRDFLYTRLGVIAGTAPQAKSIALLQAALAPMVHGLRVDSDGTLYLGPSVLLVVGPGGVVSVGFTRGAHITDATLLQPDCGDSFTFYPADEWPNNCGSGYFWRIFERAYQIAPQHCYTLEEQIRHRLENDLNTTDLDTEGHSRREWLKLVRIEVESLLLSLPADARSLRHVHLKTMDFGQEAPNHGGRISPRGAVNLVLLGLQRPDALTYLSSYRAFDDEPIAEKNAARAVSKLRHLISSAMESGGGHGRG
jgi:hypothetical protein